MMNDPPPRSGPTPEYLLLLTSHQSTLYAAISALLGGIEGAHDVLQETNVVLLEKAGAYDPARPFVPWALTFARFQVLAWRKRQTRDRLVLDDELLAAVADRLIIEQTPPSRRLDAVESCLQKLIPDWRRLIDARYVDDEAVQDIAARLGCSVNVVSVTLFRIRKVLLDCVKATLSAEGGV
ncbi:MAG: sigma-70 family RNA polymerase sigma factor [Gemmataceae bacterium]|nr:sigma-70 family RNA polymerase sigma factor [Gemmataceae bacterium]